MALTIAMVVPPTVTLNTPYAAAPKLAGWLRHLGHEVVPLDLSLDLFLRVFSREGLARMFDAIVPAEVPPAYREVYDNRDRYLRVIESAVAVLQQRDMAPAARLARPGAIPAGPNFHNPQFQASRASAGPWSRGDLARYTASLMLLDLSDLFHETISPHFGVDRYGQSLALAVASFDPIEAALSRPANTHEQMLMELAAERFPAHVDLACFTCPFPGNLMGALRLGQWLAVHRPNTRRALGGGYPSTELRELSDPRVFDYVDYIVLDDGEAPLQAICEAIEGRESALQRTFVRTDDRVVFHPATGPSPRFGDLPPPSYDGFHLDRHVHLTFVPRAFPGVGEGTWLKLTAAHGCYWKKCTFCDISLPYIADYDPMPARTLADHMDALHAQTGLTGFHFTDEAAPPALLVNLALELLRRKRDYYWWGNIRYDRAFEPDRCRLLAAAGMLRVTGGIETASDPVLAQIDKGVSVAQLVKVLQAFSGAGIGTHGYLIYGFPGETPQDTVNGLEVIRQLMAAGMLDSGYFHELGVTAHAPLGQTPERFHIRLSERQRGGFARNRLPFAYEDGQPRSPAVLDILNDVVDWYERGMHLDKPVVEWFTDHAMPAPSVSSDFVSSILRAPHPSGRARNRLCWLGGPPKWSRGRMSFRAADGRMIAGPCTEQLFRDLQRCHPDHWGADRPPTTGDFASVDWVASFQPHGLVRV